MLPLAPDGQTGPPGVPGQTKMLSEVLAATMERKLMAMGPTYGVGLGVGVGVGLDVGTAVGLPPGEDDASTPGLPVGTGELPGVPVGGGTGVVPDLGA